jgi:hypothetical protein
MDVLPVLTDPEEDQLQIVHVHQELSLMKMEDVKDVPTNVSLVQDLPITVPNVILLVKEFLDLNPIAHVSMDTSKRMKNVSNVTIDVLPVKDMKETVQSVSTLIELQLQIVSVLMDSMMKLVVLNVSHVVANVEPVKIPIQNAIFVPTTENQTLIHYVHVPTVLMKRKPVVNVDHVLIGVKLVKELLITVLNVLETELNSLLVSVKLNTITLIN